MDALYVFVAQWIKSRRLLPARSRVQILPETYIAVAKKDIAPDSESGDCGIGLRSTPVVAKRTSPGCPATRRQYPDVVQLEERPSDTRKVRGSIPLIRIVVVAEMAYAPDCGSGPCGFKSRRPPTKNPQCHTVTLAQTAETTDNRGRQRKAGKEKKCATWQRRNNSKWRKNASSFAKSRTAIFSYVELTGQQLCE